MHNLDLAQKKLYFSLLILVTIWLTQLLVKIWHLVCILTNCPFIGFLSNANFIESSFFSMITTDAMKQSLVHLFIFCLCPSSSNFSFQWHFNLNMYKDPSPFF